MDKYLKTTLQIDTIKELKTLVVILKKLTGNIVVKQNCFAYNGKALSMMIDLNFEEPFDVFIPTFEDNYIVEYYRAKMWDMYEDKIIGDEVVNDR